MIFKLYRYIRAALQLPAAALGFPAHSCRFTPSCSHYCEQAIHRFGFIKGGNLCFRRVLRCRPGVAPGHDPLPEKA